MIVLGYLRNSDGRFETFVSHRVTTILDVSTPEQWKHVPSELNAADKASRGSFDVESNWLTAPQFLSLSESQWPSSDPHENLLDERDPKCSKESQYHECSFITASTTPEPKDGLSLLISHFSNWTKLLRAVVYFKKLLTWIKNKTCSKEISVDDLSSAESSVIRHVQRTYYSQEIIRLRTGKNLPVSQSLYKLEVYLDKNDWLRVGGR